MNIRSIEEFYGPTGHGINNRVLAIDFNSPAQLQLADQIFGKGMRGESSHTKTTIYATNHMLGQQDIARLQAAGMTMHTEPRDPPVTASHYQM